MTSLIHRFDDPSSIQDWHAINDGVMGGVSFSRLRFDIGGLAVFEGEVSLLNNGGFASVRTSSLQLGRLGTVAYVLSAWGDGRTYKLNLRTDTGFDGLNYQASFNPVIGRWSQIELPVADFLPTFRGRVVQGAPSLRPDLVIQVGLMIADKRAGPFRLLVRSIEAVESVSLSAAEGRHSPPHHRDHP